MYVYVSHYFFVVLGANMIIDLKLHQWANAAILVVWAEVCMVITYILL